MDGWMDLFFGKDATNMQIFYKSGVTLTRDEYVTGLYCRPQTYRRMQRQRHM